MHLTLDLIARMMAYAAIAVLIPGIVIHVRLWRQMSKVCRVSFIGLALVLSLLAGSILLFTIC